MRLQSEVVAEVLDAVRRARGQAAGTSTGTKDLLRRLALIEDMKGTKANTKAKEWDIQTKTCLLYTFPSPRDS